MNNPRTIIHKPVITEKAAFLREGNTYAFKVEGRTNKIQIRKAIEEIFAVRVAKVRTVSMPSKPRRQGIFTGRSSAWKKAYVTLRKGDSIELAENI